MSIAKRLYDDKIWALKYRPSKIDDLILPDRIIDQLKYFVKNNTMSNLLFAGPAGVGKTSAASVLANELDCDVLYINGSIETGIDVLRTKVTRFVTTKSLDGQKKMVIIDEVDRSTPATMDALKVFLEEYSKSAYFVFATNHINKIIDPLKSRLQTIEFIFTNAEIKTLRNNFAKSLVNIFKAESVEYSIDVVKYIVMKLFPDMRKILNESQKYHQQGILNDINAIKSMIVDIDEYYEYIKADSIDFPKIRKYVAQFTDVQMFYNNIFETIIEQVDPEYIPIAIILIGKYAYEGCFGVDPQINIIAFTMELIREVKFK